MSACPAQKQVTKAGEAKPGVTSDEVIELLRQVGAEVERFFYDIKGTPPSRRPTCQVQLDAIALRTHARRLNHMASTMAYRYISYIMVAIERPSAQIAHSY